MRTPYVVALGVVTIGLTAIAIPLTDRWWVVPLLVAAFLVASYIRYKLWPLLWG